MPGARAVGARRPGAAAAKGGEGGDYAYVEVMACPGGCTNGGGQVKVGDLAEVRGEVTVGEEEGVVQPGKKPGPQEQKEWLRRVDEAYFSASSSSEDEGDDEGAVDRMMVDLDVRDEEDAMDVDDGDDGAANGTDEQLVDGISRRRVHEFLGRWSSVTGTSVDDLTRTSYRKVESDVGKAKKASDVERVAGLASTIGGGW